MAPSTRPSYHLDLGHLPPPNQSQPRSGSSTAASSPSGNGILYSQSNSGVHGLTSGGATAATARMGAGSPSHDYNSGNVSGPGSRFYPRRAREIQASEGISHSGWGPPTATGLSTPLREVIPESPSDDTFPDVANPTNLERQNSEPSMTRRARAGTVPSRFSPGLVGTNSPSQVPLASKSSRPTPSTSPFRPGTASVTEPTLSGTNNASAALNASLLSRYRAGSMPQRSNFMSNSSPFGPSVFSTSWSNNRARASSLLSTHSDNLGDGFSSPTQSAFIKEPLVDTDVKTLDYLGLAERPPGQPAGNSSASIATQAASNGGSLSAFLANPGLNRLTNNRFRSYSVNATEKYAEEEDELERSPYYSGTLTPSAEAAAAALAATQAQIRQHNLDVQAFAHQTSQNRPRARTAGLLDSTASRIRRNYIPSHSRLDQGMNVSDFGLDDVEYAGLADVVQALSLANPAAQVPLEDLVNEETTRALWLGNIPSSTTQSSLKVIFEPYGKIESARVLTHKSCGFVNFELVESAIRARAQLNGKEIFPGAGPVRIGFAKAPSASETVNGNGVPSSPSADHTDRETAPSQHLSAGASAAMASTLGGAAEQADFTPPSIREAKDELISISKEFGATESECANIAATIDRAISFDVYEMEIPPVPEASQSRLHDAPRLREIRKRIDNNACTQAEIEDMALVMLPEIAELSSDYLGNTVVQKLFEFCSEEVKEALLQEIAPHIAEIGVHKNGTWAAQKIIDVARTAAQMDLIVEHLRRYSVPSFLDQYGNYVMQCCLRFGATANSFIFECMLTQLWTVAQGRFGARAMRACLESHHASRDQQRMLAAAIALHGVQLATNANGALLLTWYLDTCTLPHRRKVLAPRMIPHLVHLCTHRVAYLTVLKLVNQRNEPDARDVILNALFYSSDDQVLTDILKDSSCGATLIYKVLTTPFFEETMRAEVIQSVRKVLTALKAQPSQGYKRLMDEVGLSTRGNGGNESQKSGGSKAASRTHSGSGPAGNATQANGGKFVQPMMQTSGVYAQNHALQPQYDPYTVAGANGAVAASTAGYMNPAATRQHPGMQQYHPQAATTPYGYPPSMMNGYSMDPYARSMATAARNGAISVSQNAPHNILAAQGAAFSPQSPAAAYTHMMGMTPGTAAGNGVPANAPGMWPQYPNGYVMAGPHGMGGHQQLGYGSPTGGGGGGGRRGRR